MIKNYTPKRDLFITQLRPCLALIFALLYYLNIGAQCPDNEALLDELYYNKSLTLNHKKAILDEVIDCCNVKLPSKTTTEKNRCAYAYQKLGNLFMSIGELERGKSQLEEAVKLYEDAGRRRRAETDIANYFSNAGQLDKAILIYQGIIASGDLVDNLPTALNLIEDYLNDGRIIEAESLWEQVEELSSELGGYRYYFYELRGWVDQAKGNTIKALDAWNEAIAAARTDYGVHSLQHAKMWLSLGERHYFPQQKYDKAQEAFQQSLAAYIPNYRPKKDKLPSTEQIGFIDDDIMMILELIARTYYYQHQSEKGASSAKLDMALECFDLIVEAETSLRQFYESDRANYMMIADRHRTMELALEISFKLYSETKDEKYLWSGLHFSELVRDVLLKEHIKEMEVGSENLIPASLVEERDQIMADFTDLITSSREEAPAYILAQRKEEISKRKAEYLQKLQRDYPNYFRFKYSYFDFDLKSIRKQLLAADQALIEYFIGEKKSYAISITQDDVSFVEIPLVAADSSYILNCISHIKGNEHGNNRRKDLYQDKAISLYRDLITPIKYDIELPQRLLIIPDGYLANLPFEALLVKEQQQTRLLLEEHICSVAFSVGVLLNQKLPDSAMDAYLGVAPVEFLDDVDYMAGSEAEVKYIQSLLGGNVLLADEATKEAILQLAKEYNVFHLATHVRLSDDEYPYILMSGNEKLSLPELHRLKLNANLVILSSCSGNAGDLKLGEGIMSLARGFNYAGCFSMMTSQWQVRQEALSGLVINYVENLKAGMDKDLALGEAKRSYLTNSSELESDPYFWAGLTQIGTTNQLYVSDGWFSFKSTFEGRFPAKAVYLLLLILGILAIVLIKNRRQTIDY